MKATEFKLSLKRSGRRVLFVSVLFVCSMKLFAQQGNLGDEQIQVVKPYQPALSEAVKVNDAPVKDTSAIEPPQLKYQVAEKRADTKYNITPIKPVRVKDEQIKKLYRGFAKAGYGNYNTPYGEFYYNAMRSKDFDAGIHLKHLSSNGKIKGYGFPGYSENNVHVFGKKFLGSSFLEARLNYDRDAVHYYGYAEPPEQYSKKETLHRISSFSGMLALESSHNDKNAFDYRASVSFYGWQDYFGKSINEGQTESDFELAGMIGKHLNNDHYLRVALSLNPSKSQLPGNFCPPGQECIQVVLPEVNINRNLISLRPSYSFEKSGILFSAGGKAVVETAYDESKWHLYPFAEARYPIIKDELSIFASVDGDMEKNSLRSLNRDNPFLIPVTAKNLETLLNTNRKVSARGGLTLKADREVQITASAGISRLKQNVFYINSLNTTGITTFTQTYLDATVLNVHAGAEYDHEDKSGISFGLDYYNYAMEDGEEAWYQPSLKAKAEGKYRIGDKIYAKLSASYTGSRLAPGIAENVTLKSFADINFGVDYRYSKLLSVFVQLNNLAASRQFTWYRYPSQRINAMAGATLSF